MHYFSDLTCMEPVRKGCMPHTPSSMVWQVLLLAIGYIQYKMVSFPQENVQSVQFVDVSSVPECCLQGLTWNQKILHAVNNKL